MTESLLDGSSAAPLSIRATGVVASAVVRAARRLLTDLERGRRIDAAGLRAAMEAAFGASDAAGAWNWKTAYDACEAATVLFLRRHGAAMRAKAASPAAMLPMLTKITNLLPTQTRRSLESESLQQFSTPIGLAFVASIAAAITPADVVLEPSAGTGLLAIFAELSGASLILNEFAETRAGILSGLFPGVSTTQFDAAYIHDHLDAGIVPGVVLMNPPFSAAVHVDRRMADSALRHVASALARLPEGGRLVTISGANVAPDHPAWTDSFIRLQERDRVVFSAAIDGAVYARHGTTIDTRLTVIDRVPADDLTQFPPSPGVAPDLPTLLGWVTQYVPPRRPIAGMAPAGVPAIANPSMPRTVRAYVGQRQAAAAGPAVDLVATEIAYEPVDWTPTNAKITDALYEEYVLQSIRIPGAQPHPTRLVQSAAMASIYPKNIGKPRRLALLVVLALSGCTTFKPPQISYDDELPPPPDLPTPADDRARPLHVPPSWTPARGGKKGDGEAKEPAERVTAANDAARVQPRQAGYFNAVQIFPYSPGALYQIYAAPGQITDIALEPGEQLTGSGPLAAGDTVRWIVADTESGNGDARRVHIMVKPTRPAIETNLVVNTDRRTYLIELRSREKPYMPSVAWFYPEDRSGRSKAFPLTPAIPEVEQRRYRYVIEGDSPPWRPVNAYDDGRKVYIEFSPGIGQGEMPPLFVIGEDGKPELVNYRAYKNVLIVDRLFAAAELRLGGEKQQKVRIVRNDGRRS